MWVGRYAGFLRVPYNWAQARSGGVCRSKLYWVVVGGGLVIGGSISGAPIDARLPFTRTTYTPNKEQSNTDVVQVFIQVKRYSES